MTDDFFFKSFSGGAGRRGGKGGSSNFLNSFRAERPARKLAGLEIPWAHGPGKRAAGLRGFSGRRGGEGNAQLRAPTPFRDARLEWGAELTQQPR